MFDAHESQPLDRTPRHEWISRIASTVVAFAYLGFCISIGSQGAFVGLLPYLALALVCTWFPRWMGQGRRPRPEDGFVIEFQWRRWNFTPPWLVLAGGWLLLLLPAIVGVALWVSR